MPAIARRVSRLLRERVAQPAFFRFEYAIDRRFDERCGIETVERAHLDDLTIDSANVEFGDDEEIYVAVPVLALGAMRKVLPDDLDRCTFVDFGSGKGRVLLYASQFPFARIVGVEFAEELHRVAERTVAAGRHPKQRCHDVGVLLQDAMEFEIPDGPCVFFLFNPFERYVLERVVGNICASFERSPRPMHVVYHNPRYADVFARSNVFERTWSRPRSRRSECYEVATFRSRRTP